MAGLTYEGLVIKTLAEIREDINTRLRQKFGASVNLDDDSVIGQIRDPFAEELALAWQTLQQVYDSFDPDAAEGAQLDNVVSFMLIERFGNAFSTGEVTFSGDVGTVVDAETIVEVPSTHNRFETVDDVELTSDGAGGGEALAAVIAVEPGPIEAKSGDITKIVTPVAGVDSVVNASDIKPGRNREEDPDLRVRRQEAVDRSGVNDQEVYEALLAIEGVSEASVLTNGTDVTDSLGIPSHSFEALVWPDPQSGAGSSIDENEIVAAIFNNQAGGIRSHGDNGFTVTDKTGRSRPVYYSAFTGVDIWIEIDVTVNSDYPSNGDAQVEEMLLDVGENNSGGDDVLMLKLLTAADKVDGVVSADVRIGDTSGGVTASNYTIEDNEIAIFDSSRITVTQV